MKEKASEVIQASKAFLRNVEAIHDRQRESLPSDRFRTSK